MLSWGGVRPVCFSHQPEAQCGLRFLDSSSLKIVFRACIPAPSGKSDEQRAAAALASVLCVQLGPGLESEEILKTLGPILKKIICDGTANIQARQTVSM